jgi:hypothetical protein
VRFPDWRIGEREDFFRRLREWTVAASYRKEAQRAFKLAGLDPEAGDAGLFAIAFANEVRGKIVLEQTDEAHEYQRRLMVKELYGVGRVQSVRESYRKVRDVLAGLAVGVGSGLVIDQLANAEVLTSLGVGAGTTAVVYSGLQEISRRRNHVSRLTGLQKSSRRAVDAWLSTIRFTVQTNSMIGDEQKSCWRLCVTVADSSEDGASDLSDLLAKLTQNRACATRPETDDQILLELSELQSLAAEANDDELRALLTDLGSSLRYAPGNIVATLPALQAALKDS